MRFPSCIRPLANSGNGKAPVLKPELVTLKIKITKEGLIQCKLRPVGAKKGIAKRLDALMTQQGAAAASMRKAIAARKLKYTQKAQARKQYKRRYTQQRKFGAEAIRIGEAVVVIRLTSEVEHSKETGDKGSAAALRGLRGLIARSSRRLSGLKRRLFK